MKVIKKDGRIQEFNIEKIKVTLGYVSDEVHEPLTSSDIDMIARRVEKVVKESNEDNIHSTVIYDILLKELNDMGFSHIAKRYAEFEKDYN